MITRARRYMTSDEQIEVERLERDSREAIGCQLAIFALTALLFVGAGVILGASLGERFPGEELRFAGSGAVGGVLALLYVWKGPRRKRNLGFAHDRFETEVDLLHVHAFAVASATAIEAFLFDVGEGKVLVVRGAATRTVVSAGRFPNRYFTLVRAARGDRTLKIECHGEPLPAREVAGASGLDDATLGDAVVLPASALGPGWRP